jgi:hypothetical protein
MSVIGSTSRSLHSKLVLLLFLQTHLETDRFFTTSEGHLPQSTSGLFHFHHEVFSSQIKTKVDNILTKDVVLHITFNIDDTSISSRSHTHPSHSRLLTSETRLYF